MCLRCLQKNLQHLPLRVRRWLHRECVRVRCVVRYYHIEINQVHFILYLSSLNYLLSQISSASRTRAALRAPATTTCRATPAFVTASTWERIVSQVRKLQVIPRHVTVGNLSSLKIQFQFTVYIQQYVHVRPMYVAERPIHVSVTTASGTYASSDCPVYVTLIGDADNSCQERYLASDFVRAT